MGLSPTAASFQLTPDQRTVLDTVDRFARQHFYPLAERMDREEWWPPEALPRLGQAGFLGVTVPQELGGAGMDVLTSGLVGQAISRWNHALGLSFLAHENLCLNNIHRSANEALKKKYLPGLCAGTSIGCLALTEPGAGSDLLGSMSTTARRDGDHFVLNGNKLYITNGPVADVVLIYARMADGPSKGGLSAFIIEKDFPGYRVAQKLEKMGFRGSPTGELVLEDCRIPVENLVGEEGRGHRNLMGGLDIERATIAPIALGIAERAMQLTIAHAKQRRQFGKAIGQFGMIKAKLAQMYVRLETMRTFIYRTLEACNQLESGAGGKGDIHALTAGSILYASESLKEILDEAVQIHGGIGCMWEAEINRLYRANKVLEIGAGTNEIRQLVISQELLR
jgi:isovaleryl-CoA dehydrogenase